MWRAMTTVILMLAFIPSATAADNPKMIRCETHAGDKHTYWSWREIDGRQCWFRGHGIPKNQLFWERDEAKPEIRTELPAAIDEPRQSQPSIVILPLRHSSVFEWHWRDLMIEMNWQAWIDRRLMQEWRIP